MPFSSENWWDAPSPLTMIEFGHTCIELKYSTPRNTPTNRYALRAAYRCSEVMTVERREKRSAPNTAYSAIRV